MNGDLQPVDETFLAQFLDDYFAECEEHLAIVRRGLLALEAFVDQPQVDQALLEELFRSFHSLKGTSGMMGVKPVEEVAHNVESYLRHLRRGQHTLTAPALDALIIAARSLEDLLAARRHNQPLPPIAAILAQLTALTTPPPLVPPSPPPLVPPSPPPLVRPSPPPLVSPSPLLPVPPSPLLPVPPSPPPLVSPDSLTPNEQIRLQAAVAAGNRAWLIEFTPAPELAQRGVNVDAIRSRLRDLGELIRATPIIKPHGGISFQFLLVTPADPAHLQTMTADGLRCTIFPSPPLPVPPSPPLPVPPSPPLSVPPSPSPLVRVDLSRLDDLMQMVGELVISRARLEDNLRRLNHDAQAVSLSGKTVAAYWHSLQETNLAIERQLRDLREGVMRLRLVPIGEAFERMQFAVRDLAREGGKTVALTLSGQTTEIDKYVVERMLDPLLHLVRNAVSHGLETPAERTAAGKPPQGRIFLRAAAAGDAVVIEIEDDGRGMNLEQIAGKARVAGLLPADALLDADNLLDVLCAPGFSTRDEADRASGRGVGMAVVRNTVQELGGALSLWTEPGRGSRFTIELPLTLAIVDALIVSAGDQTFAVPQPSVREVAEVPASALTILENNELIVHRGGVLPVVRLSRLFDLPPETGSMLYLLIIGAGTNAVGIAVSRIHGQREIVVRAMTDPLVRLPGIAGATELGDGRVVLILDAAALARLHRETVNRTNAAPVVHPIPPKLGSGESAVAAPSAVRRS